MDSATLRKELVTLERLEQKLDGNERYRVINQSNKIRDRLYLIAEKSAIHSLLVKHHNKKYLVPAVDIELFCFSDKRWSWGLTVDLPESGMGIGFDFEKTHRSRKEAERAAVKCALDWLKKEQKRGPSTEIMQIEITRLRKEINIFAALI